MSLKGRALACFGLAWILTFPGCARTTPSPPPPGSDDPGPEPFSETLGLGSSDLWVGGHEILGPTVTCTWDGSSMNFNGVGDVLFYIPNPEPDEFETQLKRTYGEVPIVRKQLTEGKTIHESVDRFMAEKYNLWTAARERFLAEGVPTAVSHLRASPLVSYVAASRSSIRIEYVGLGGSHSISLDMLKTRVPYDNGLRLEPPPTFRYKVRDVLAEIKTTIQQTAPRGALIILTRSGSLRIATGQRRDSLRGQIDLIKSGRTLESLGRRAERPPLSEIIEVQREGH